MDLISHAAAAARGCGCRNPPAMHRNDPSHFLSMLGKLQESHSDRPKTRGDWTRAPKEYGMCWG
jgi:hypothetical protein